jgi:hypothetical protein
VHKTCEEIQRVWSAGGVDCELTALIDGRPGRYTFARPLSASSAAENGAFFFWLR